MNKIAKVLSVGDVVYSAETGGAMRVTRIYTNGFETDEGYFSFDDVRSLYWLTKRGYRESKRRKMMTLEKAIKLLEKEYERAKGLEYVRKPLAYALFRVWKSVDKEKDNG